MKTNAQKVQEWREAHPGTRLSPSILRETIDLADLRWADLRGADLRGANLYGANLREAKGVLHIPAGLPSGELTLWHHDEEWRVRVGCWEGTPDDLRALIAKDRDWPEAEGEEIKRRRPLLEAALTLIEAFITDTTS